MTASPPPGTAIDIPGAANVRDLGGWATSAGKAVRRGEVYRSTELNGVTPPGLRRLSSLGVRTVFDLRTVAERDAQPDRLPDGATEIHLDVLADDPSNAAAGAAELPKLLGDPALLDKFLSGTSFTEMFSEAYRGVVSLPSALASYRRMFLSIADPAKRPALFHCTTGKDRTGWGAAALLTLLDVDHDDVMADYLLTNSEILPLTQPFYDAFAAAGGNPDVLRPALGVDASYLDIAFEEMTSRYGTIDRYFNEGLELDDATLDALRDGLTIGR